MENIKNDHALRTEKLLLSVWDYCQANDLKMWRTDSTFFTKYFIGEETDLNSAKKSPFNYRSASIEEVKKEEILNSNHYFILRNGGCDKNVTINPDMEWAQYNDGSHYTQLYVHVFLENDKEIAKHFADDWFKGTINLTHAIDYKDKNYPDGFRDKKIISSNLEKNWDNFIDTFDGELLTRFWENEDFFDEFCGKIKELDPDGSKGMANLFLNKLSEKLCETGLSDNSKLKTSYMLMEFIPESIHEEYAQRFPIMKNIIDAKNNKNLFQQTEDEITERCVLPYGHIYEHFKFAGLKASQYDSIAIEALRFIAENHQLEEKGLIFANAFPDTDNILFFITVSDNTLINKNSMKDLFISSLETFFKHNDVVLTSNPAGAVDNREILRKIVNTNIEHWLLKDELNQSNGTDPIPKKIKKM